MADYCTGSSVIDLTVDPDGERKALIYDLTIDCEEQCCSSKLPSQTVKKDQCMTTSCKKINAKGKY